MMPRLLQYHFNMFRFADTDDNCFSSVSSMPTKSPSPILLPTSSPPPANETFQRNQVFLPFSPSTVKAINFKGGTSESISESGSGSCGTLIGTNKFKPKVDTVVVPPSDNFLKRKKNAMDGFLGETTKMMDRMASTIETVVSSRQTKKALLEDSALSSLSGTIAHIMQDVPKAKRRMCLVKILQIIEEFAE